MNTPTTHTEGAGRVFNRNQEEWKELARQSLRGPLPPGVDPLKYPGLVATAVKMDFTAKSEVQVKAINLINYVREFQNDQGRVPTLPANNSSNGVSAQEPTKAEAAPAQDTVEDVQPGIEMGVNENGLNGQTALAEEASFKESLKEAVKEIRDNIGIKELHAQARMSTINAHKASPEAKAQAEKELTNINAEIKLLKENLKVAEQAWRSVPVDDGADKDRPWYGKVYANGTGYYIEDGCGGWTQVTEENAKRELKAMGISPRPDSETTTPLDRALLAIQKRHKVEYAGPLAGYKAGVTKQNGMTVLVTSTTELIEPVEGDFPILNAILNGLLKEDRVYFDAFCRVTYEGLTLCLESGKNTPGPVLVLAGPKHCGKSLIQYHVLTPLLGGKVARPYLFMSGQTSFNGELANAGHHILEDEVPTKDISARRKFGNYIKKAAANKGVEIHGKGKDIKNLTPFTRLSISVNDDEECLEVLPPLDDHLSDKLLILKCFKFPLPMPANTPAEQAALEKAIKRELSAYFHWLLNVFQIPQHIKEGGRGGFKVVQNEDILEKINGTAPELNLREVLENTYFSGEIPKKAVWVKLGSAQDILHRFTIDSNAVKRLLPTVRACGTYLSRLTEKYPKQFRKYRGHGGVYRYEMYLDPEYIKAYKADN